MNVIQLPAFLAHQTGLAGVVAETGAVINVRKPQFISPRQMGNIVDELKEDGNEKVISCNRGANLGYDNLVVDMLGFSTIKKVPGGSPVIFDITYALQYRDPSGAVSGSHRAQVAELARTDMTTGLAGLFVKAHPDPKHAECNDSSTPSLTKLEPLLKQMKIIDDLVKGFEELDIGK